MTIRLPPIRVILSYLLDWISIATIAAMGGGLKFVTPYKRPFSLLDLDISLPLVTESIKTSTLALAALVAPAVIIVLVVLLFVPGPSFLRSCQRSEALKLKAWELNQGLAGLALSVATAFFITQGTKNLFGKPRPDMLARCMPDLNNVAAHLVGVNYGQPFSPRWALVSATICTNPDEATLDDGFRSFPSGHSSFSWGGLLYLSLFLCSKFNITIPSLSLSPPTETPLRAKSNEFEMLPVTRPREPAQDAPQKFSHDSTATQAALLRAQAAHVNPLQMRNYAASPPNYLIIPAFVPVAAAIYISSTRYVEFYHFGFDIICGTTIGILAAWASFRWYHLPLSRGRGWAWGPRSRDCAFGIGVGSSGYISSEQQERRERKTDIETGR